ncbi:MAG: substrate-binding domain-containing protein [Pseudoxanthomonas sp.]|nr:substrate-binding domain-containing protein [Pseudoxanthomonas sp.]
MTGSIVRIALALLVLVLGAAPARAQDDVERMRIHGSNSIGATLMPALVEDWLASMDYQQVRRVPRSPALMEIHAVRDGLPLVVEIDKHGAAPGFAALVRGDAELAMLARQPDPRERDDGWQLGDLSSPEQEYVLALNGAAVVVNKDNPLRRIDVAQLRALLAGEVRDWSQLGGRGGPVRVQLGPERGGLEDFVRERITAGRTPHPATLVRNGDLRAAARAVAHDPSALAIVELTTPLPAGVRAVAVADGGVAVAPDAAGVRSRDYPLVRPYTLYGGQMMSALGRSFAMYTITARAQDVVRAQGLVALDVAAPPAVAADATVRLPEEYRHAVDGAVRLPLALRFNLKSLTTIYDGYSAQQLERVVAWMKRPENRGRSLSVVGFASEDPGNRLFATTTSNNRADIVVAYLVGNGIAVQRSRGLGSLQPLAAGDDENARRRNERVELWLL